MDAMIGPTLFKLAIATMAAWQIVETLHHGSIFADLRQWANRRLSSENWCIHKLATLISCPFCLSHWSPILPILAMFYGPIEAQFLVVSLAVTRTTQLLNDLTHSHSRTPFSDEAIEIDETVGQQVPK